MVQGGQAVLAQEQSDAFVGAPGRAPDQPASFCGKMMGTPAGILFPPMLFAHNPAKGGTSGPQARFSAEKREQK
jgi:hypothetical protein